MVKLQVRRMSKVIQRLLHAFPRVWKLASQCRIALQPRSASAHLALGHALAQQGKHAQAAASFQRAAVLCPDSADAHLALGQAHGELGQHEQAVAALSQAVLIQPHLLEARMGLGWAHVRLKQDELAATEFSKAAACQPGSLAAHLALGWAHFRLGKDEKAQADFTQAVQIRCDCADAHRGLAQTQLRQGHPSLALASIERAVALEPDCLENSLCLGHVLAQLGRHDEAADQFRRVLAVRSDMADAHNGLGMALLAQNRLGRHEDAAACFRAAAQIAPDSFAAHLMLGKVLIFLNNSASAIESLKKAVQLEPNKVEAHLALVDALARSGNLAEAIQKCKQASRLREDSAPDLVLLGIQLAQLGVFSSADDVWNRAIALEPLRLQNYVKIWANLLDTGKIDDANRYYQQNRDLQKKLAELRHADVGVRYLRSSWTRHIGHISQIDRYIKTGLLGWRSPQRTVVLAPPHKVANRYYLDHFRPYVEIISDAARVQELTSKVRCLEDYCQLVSLFDGQTNLNAASATALVQNQWEAEGRAPLLTLSGECMERGQRALQTMGVPPGAWFVGVHIRESGFYAFDHHHEIRNGDPRTYEAAFRSIRARGGWVIRMGDPSMTPLPPLPGVIDYAHSEHRCDWLDVFLCARCRFYIGTQSGLSNVPATFGVPTVITNYISALAPPFGRENLFIQKRCWSDRENRYLTLEEIIGSGLGYAQSSTDFLRLGVRIEDNTSEEIDDVVQEMMDWLDGTVRYTEEDRRLREMFSHAARKLGVVVSSPLGQAYLRQNARRLSLAA